MILMYIHDSFGGRVPDFDLEKIGKIIETREEGTYAEDVLNLNKVKEVKTAIPSIEFEVELKNHTLNEIFDELNDRQPPIAWIKLSDTAGHACGHAVVITDLDKKNNKIFYNDPIFGEVVEGLPSFLDRWDHEDRVLIKVKIGKKPQRMLEEFQEGKPLTEQVVK
jgi:hypothetical protein